MKADGLRILGWVIPIFCMIVASWILFKERSDFAAADLARNNAHRDNELAQKEYESIIMQPPGLRYAAADDLPQEEIAFLTYLRTSCAAHNVNFKSWTSQTVEYGKDKETSTKDPKLDALLKGIRKISAGITLIGSYEDLRKLIGEMESSTRLYSLTNLNWTNQKAATQLIVSVSRYVKPTDPAAKQAAAKPVAKPVTPTVISKQAALPIKTTTTPVSTPPDQPGTHTGTTIKP